MIDKLKSITLVSENFDLKKYNTFKLESTAKYFIRPLNVEELINVLKVLNDYNQKYFIIGNGSNILLPFYYDGVIIKLDKLNNYSIENDVLLCESGCMINKLASITANKGYSGLDFAVGIPGTIGASVYGNAGCYGSSISDSLISATVFDGKKIIELTNKDFEFDYRESKLKKDKNNYVVLSCKFKLNKSNKEELKQLIIERTNKRIASQDLSHPSNGSMFRNPPGLIAGKLIDDLGLKGYKVGDAMVSFKHANFIINDGNAKVEDVIKLIEKIKKDVKEKYNVDLVLEQEIIK